MNQERDIWERVMESRPDIIQLSVQFDMEREIYFEDKWFSNLKKAQCEHMVVLLPTNANDFSGFRNCVLF